MTTTATPKMMVDLPRVYVLRVAEVSVRESKPLGRTYTVATFDYLGTEYNHVLRWYDVDNVLVEPPAADWLRARVNKTIACKLENKVTRQYGAPYTHVTFADTPGEL